MDDARKLLDSLMGPSRDKGKEEQKRADGWKESNVCKRYLVGFCPNNSQDNWFKNTRRDLIIGTCDKIHSDRLKEQFLAHPERNKYEPQYTKDFLRFLEGMVFEADAWIAREQRNCKPAGKEVRIPPEVWSNIEEMQKQSEVLLKTAEDLAEKGQIARSKIASNSSTKLVEDIEGIKAKYTFNSGGEEVCKICGVRCAPAIAGESADYQAHLDGKLHEGYSRVREKVQELREVVRLYNRDGMRDDGDRDRDRDRDRSPRGRGDKDRSPKGRGDKDRDNNTGNADRGDKDPEEKDQLDQDRVDKDRGDKDRGGKDDDRRDRGDRDRRGRDRRGRDGGRDSRDDPRRSRRRRGGRDSRSRSRRRR